MILQFIIFSSLLREPEPSRPRRVSLVLVTKSLLIFTWFLPGMILDADRQFFAGA
jgi:hypothetical protein